MKRLGIFAIVCWLLLLPAGAQTVLNHIGEVSSYSTSGDFNGDGITDFVYIGILPHNVVQLQIYLGYGDGFVYDRKTTNLPSDIASGVVELNPTGGPADFDGDGKLDAVFCTAGPASGSILVAFGNGDGTFSRIQQITLPASLGAVQLINDFPSLYAVDVNHDQHADILFEDSKGTIASFLGNGDGTFQSPVLTSSPGPSGIQGIGDVNNDGFPDIITETTTSQFYQSTGKENFYLLVGDGHGGFGAGTLVNPEPVGGIFTFLGLQDINHDNFADAVFWVTSSGSTYAAVVLAWKQQRPFRGGGQPVFLYWWWHFEWP